MKNYTVAINKYTKYDENLTNLLFEQMKAAGVSKEMLDNKKIAIKPNLVISKKPEAAATTHPVFLKSAISALKMFGAENTTLIVAESAGGPYTTATIKNHYSVCGIDESCGAPLNYSTDAQIVMFPEGETCKRFNVISPIAEADVILNVCKLKTHSLTKISCAQKNYFGIIPGIEKFEMHAAYSDQKDFRRMLCDLSEMLRKSKTLINVCDGILGMEGNGPTGGTPRKFDVVLTSLSPYCLDLAAEKILGFEGTAPMVTLAKEKGLCPDSADKLNIVGDKIDELVINDVVAPDAQRKTFLSELHGLFGGKVADFFSPKPYINSNKCVGCGECVRSCPMHTIELVEKNGKKQAKINRNKCILCYCCQELCPLVAVDVKQNILIRLVH
ncbi:MAG: DUF362 domain-containing protein [Clostridia bacterium]|nr:DUF362 domain-containing protein [Clostridia bacterium]